MSSNSEDLHLPPLIELSAYEGNFRDYLAAVYAQYSQDFRGSRLAFKGRRLGIKKMPVREGMEATFYHLTHDGADENNREPNLRRMERIRWVRVLLDNVNHPEILSWENSRGRDKSILLFCEKENYLVVLRDRGEYVLLWTAYLVDHKHQKQKLLREYNAWKNADAAS